MEQQTKAFEARVSQWNRKLSAVHSEEKRQQHRQAQLAQRIVEAFEDARNYKPGDEQKQPRRQNSNHEFETEGREQIEDETQPQVANREPFSLEPIKQKLMLQSAEVRIDDMAATVEVDRELDQFIKAHALGKQRGKL